MDEWKAWTLEHLTKAILFDKMLQNWGEELFVVLDEAQLSMVQ
jgi:hypothetical protein